jgi:regulator of protease activity HflC (stomatin/prohibitin superfamily)
MDIFWLIFGLVCAGLIVLAVKAVVVVPQAHKRNVERLGKYYRTFEPGLHLIVPFVFRLRPMIDLREQVLSLREPVITSDKVDLRIDIVVFFKVTDAYKADYGIAHYFVAAEKFAGTVLRNVVGKMTLNDALTAREWINDELNVKLNETAKPSWGIKVTRVEVMTIDPPQSVKDAMETRQGEILRAEGQAEAIGKIFAAIHAGDPDQKLLAYEYLEMLPKLAQGPGSTVVVIPSELTGALKALGSAFGADQQAAPEGPAKPGAAEPGAPHAA